MHRCLRFPAGRTDAVSVGSLALAGLEDVPPRLAPLPRAAELEGLTVLLAEVLTGARAPRQAADHTTDRVYAALLRRRMSLGVRRFAPRLRSWRMQTVAPGAVEVAAVFWWDDSVHAMALRFEHHSRWLCTTIETA